MSREIIANELYSILESVLLDFYTVEPYFMVTDIVLIGTSSSSSTTSLRKLKFFFPSSLSKKYSKEKPQINEFCKWIVPTDVEYLQLEIDHH